MHPDDSHSWEVRGETRENLFQNAARSLTARLVDEETLTPGGLRDRIQIEVENEQALLTAWLTRLLGLYQRERVVFARFFFRTLTATHLDADVDGELLDPYRHNAKPLTPKATLKTTQKPPKISYLIELISP